METHCVSEITGNNIATTNSSQTHVTNENHIYLEDVYSVNITGNQFWGWGYYNNENDCTRGVVLGPLCHHVSLDCNHHMHKGIGILNEDATNFDIVIGDSCVWQSRTSGGDKFAVSGPTVKIKNDVGGDLRIGGWKKTEFLPELSFGNQSDGITYSERSGVMYRRGNEVYGHLYINLSSKGTATGSVGIGADVGLPPAETEFSGNITVNYLANATFTDETIPIGFLSGDKIRLRDATTNLTSVATDAEFGNITTLRLTFRYFAEQD